MYVDTVHAAACRYGNVIHIQKPFSSTDTPPPTTLIGLLTITACTTNTTIFYTHFNAFPVIYWLHIFRTSYRRF